MHANFHSLWLDKAVRLFAQMKFFSKLHELQAPFSNMLHVGNNNTL